MALHKEGERICRELGHKAGLQASLGSQALILQARGDLEGAMALHKEEERICRELGLAEGLGISLYNQARLLLDLDQIRDAVSLAEDAHRLAGQSGLTVLARQTQGILDSLHAATGAAQGGRAWVSGAGEHGELAHRATGPTETRPSVDIPSPHPRADPKRAAALNRKYLEELERWRALPVWKRRLVKKPERPAGI